MEVLNIYNLQFNYTVIDLVMNYVALQCISCFDDSFASAYASLTAMYTERSYVIENSRSDHYVMTSEETYNKLDQRLKNMLDRDAQFTRALLDRGDQINKPLYKYIMFPTRIQMEFAARVDEFKKNGVVAEVDAFEITNKKARAIRVIFKVLRCFYVTFYYYLMPFSIIFVSLYMLDTAVQSNQITDISPDF